MSVELRIDVTSHAFDPMLSTRCWCGWPETSDCVIRAYGSKPEENRHLECAERDYANTDRTEIA